MLYNAEGILVYDCCSLLIATVIFLKISVGAVNFVSVLVTHTDWRAVTISESSH